MLGQTHGRLQNSPPCSHKDIGNDVPLSIRHSSANMGAFTSVLATARPDASLVAAEVEVLKAKARAIDATSRAKVRAIDAATDAGLRANNTATLLSFAPLAPLAITLALAAALAADFYVHESPGYIRRRMVRTLRACRLPASVPASRPRLMPVSQSPLTPSFVPTMLLGPTGCGKSTALYEIARGAVTAPVPKPVVLVRVRLTQNDVGVGTSPTSAAVLMESTARQIFTQIGFPLRRSLLGSVFARGFTLNGQHNQADLASSLTPRIVMALDTLFSACEELYRLRVAQGIPKQDAAPVILFDEVQDLVKDKRLKLVGGDDIFKMLAAMVVSHSVDGQSVKAVFAGSSAELAFAFSRTTARGNRWSYYDLRDPSPDSLVAALVERNYSEAEARSMIAVCGTRLRLFDAPLNKGAERELASDFLLAAVAESCSTFDQLFLELEDEDAAASIVCVLDAIALADAEGAGRRRPTKMDLPKVYREADVAPILFVNRSYELFFQSQLHAHAWTLVRNKYAAPRALLA